MTIHEDPKNRSAAVLHKLANFTDKRVLEIGCGEGRMTWEYAAQAAHVTAMDPNADRIIAARSNTPPDLRERMRFLVSGIEAYIHPANEPKFDIAFFSWSL